MAKISQHPYGTRANHKRMENLAKAVQSVKIDVNQLRDQMKDQMAQILEALAAMKSTRESPEIRNEEAISSNPVM